MVGAKPITVGGNSCACIAGYVWDANQQICVCDYKQNFFIINGICWDCALVPNSNGFASSNGCGCKSGLMWISSSSSCACPAGYVNIGGICQDCLKATLTAPATVAGCQSCNNVQGFVQGVSSCQLCSSMQRTSGTVSNGNCVCSNTTLAWHS